MTYALLAGADVRVRRAATLLLDVEQRKLQSKRKQRSLRVHNNNLDTDIMTLSQLSLTLTARISLFSTSVARLFGRLLATLPDSDMTSSAAAPPASVAGSGLALLPRPVLLLLLLYIFLACKHPHMFV